jgi:glycerol kinase
MGALLAIDQGTTGTTALVLGLDGRLLARAYREVPCLYPEPGSVQQDPKVLLSRSLEAIGEALAKAALPEGALRAIGIANQRETSLLWGRASGEPLDVAIVWQSRETQALCEALKAAGHEPLVRERTGLLLDPYFSATKVRALLDRHPGERARAERGELCFGTVDSWLLYALTGGAVHATDPTNASRTLLFDTARGEWDPDLLALFSVPAALLPKVLPSAGLFGHTRALGPLPAGVPITGIAGDQQAALYGQGGFEVGSAKNTYGTGCFLVLNAGGERPTPPPGLLATLACDERGGVCHALEGSVFVAGAAVQWVRDELGLVSRAAETDALAASVPDTGGVYLVPAFAGLGAPHWDPSARGAIVGLTRGTSRAHLVRATLESIAFQTRDVVEAMAGAARLDALHVDGGGSANDFLMQFQADILGVPVSRPAFLETTALGAGLLAGRGAGLLEDAQAAGELRSIDRVFEPRMPEGRREELYRGWRKAVDRVLLR